MRQHKYVLTLNLLTTTIIAPPSNASKWQMGFNSAFKGLRKERCTAAPSKLMMRLGLSKSKCTVYTICRQKQLSTRWYANLLNLNLNYIFRPQSLAIIRLWPFIQSDDGKTLWPKHVVEIYV